MNDTGHVIALDQGTTSSRAILYDRSGQEIAIAQRPLAISCPQDGFVEQNPEEILETQLDALNEVAALLPQGAVSALGITNQRETVICWDRTTGKALFPAIVWQCRRSGPICRALREGGHSERIRQKTGLVLDPYFSASKIQWLMENHPGLRSLTEKGQIAFGTVDSWLVYNLTGGKNGGQLLTESSNASRTMLFNIREGVWDQELLDLFNVDRRCLPEIRRSAGDFGLATFGKGRAPIRAILGDQQASLFGHGCLQVDTLKCTFGTGAFLLMNSGEKIPASEGGLLATVAWELDGKRIYALEGAVFIAGALIQWLRDGLGIIETSSDVERLAGSVNDSKGAVIVPAFVGLGAPHWDENARGAIWGLTRDTNRAHIARAALEGVAHQVADMLELSQFRAVRYMSIDGGMSRNKLFCQILADLADVEVHVPARSELTAYGVAKLAQDPLLAANGSIQHGAAKDFNVVRPGMPGAERQRLRSSWKLALDRTLTGKR